MEFHKQLEVERKKAGLTLKKLAQIITENTGNIITSDRLRNWELGISDIDISSLSYLCKLIILVLIISWIVRLSRT